VTVVGLRSHLAKVGDIVDTVDLVAAALVDVREALGVAEPPLLLDVGVDPVLRRRRRREQLVECVVVAASGGGGW
jgi:hypothetical protein